MQPFDTLLRLDAPRSSDQAPRSELPLRAAVREVVRLLEADGALVYLLAEDGAGLRFAAEASEVRLAAAHWIGTVELRVGHGIIGRCVADRSVVVTGDYLADPRFRHTEQTDAFARETGLRSFVTAPLVIGDQALGALGVYDRRVDAFGLQQTALVRVLADRAALEITHARLVAELELARRVTKRQADLERALRELVTRISSESDPNSVMALVVEEAMRLTGGDGGRVDILDPAGGELFGVYASDRDRADDTTWPLDLQHGAAIGLSVRAVASGRPAVTGDLLGDAPFPHPPGAEDFAADAVVRSAAAVPLFGDGGPLGALTIWALRADAFDGDDIALLQTIAGQAAGVLVRARLIEQLGRSREALARRAEEERALRNLAWRALTSLDLSGVLDDVVAEAARLLGPSGATVELAQPAPSGLRRRSSGITAGRLDAWLATDGAGASGRAIAGRQTVVGEGTAGIRSWAIAPMVGESSVLGTLAVLSPLPGAYGPDQIELLGSLADHAALALAGVGLMARVEESEERYRSLVESLPDLVFACDAEGVFTFLSESVVGVLGWTRGELVGTHFRDIVVGPNGDRSPGRRFASLRMNPERAMVTRFELRTKGGDTKPVEVAAAAIVRDGAFAGVHGSARDVSDQERLARELRESETRYRYLVESSPDLVWMTDAAGRLTFVSHRALPVLGWAPADLIGRSFADLVPIENRRMAAARYQLLRRHPTEAHRSRFRVRAADGRERFVEVTGIGMLDADGGFIGAHGAVRDIGELDRLEGDLRRHAADLAASEERAHLARELHDSVTQALFSMTLQLRSVELLMARDPALVPGKLTELRELQRDALAEMRALIFELRPGNLAEQGLVSALRTHAAGLSGRIGLSIVVEGELGARRPSLDAEEALYRIAQEALHNVVKHAGARQVRVEIGRHADGVRVRVEDDGHGFDPAAVRAGHLGLAGMRTRAERLGGRLEVVSRPGRGTAVEAVIPWAAARNADHGAVAVRPRGVRP